MKKGMICVGLAIYSLAGSGALSQEADVAGSSATVSTTAEAESDTTIQENGAKPKRRVRLEKKIPGGGVQVEEFSDDFDAPKPNVRRRVEIFDDEGNEDVFRGRKLEVRPQIRVFPKEREVLIKRGPGQREMRIELDTDDAGEAVARREIRTAVRKFGGGDELSSADASIEHLEEAIRHLKKAKMREAAERLEAELEQLRASRQKAESELNEQLRSLREERDTLKGELQKLKDELRAKKDAGEKDDVGKRQ